ncbi:hypothetical protein, partial [Sphingomonas sp. CCH21-G11]
MRAAPQQRIGADLPKSGMAKASATTWRIAHYDTDRHVTAWQRGNARMRLDDLDPSDNVRDLGSGGG